MARHRDRIERYNRARREGMKARRDGVLEDANPYKISPWGLGLFWLSGWWDEDDHIRETSPDLVQH